VTSMKIRKKLIEVALPLEAINVASAREKSIRHGHPSTLHLWWARRPLAAARAVIFAQMVDDPSSWPDLFPTEKAQTKERERLFDIIKDLVKWENTTNEAVLQKARDEIWQSWRRACAENADHPRAKELFDRHKLPAFHDPFAGGGALPLEAQRLGLEAYASDLNPVAVLINKAMIEIPPRFGGRPPVNPDARDRKDLVGRKWKGAEGLANDVRYYGQWMRNEAEKRIGHLYPKVTITAEMAKQRPELKPYLGRKLTVIAWLWARTVKSPNPAFADVDVPLASTFALSRMKGNEAVVHPIVEGGNYRFEVKKGTAVDLERAKNGTKLARANFVCVMSGTPISNDYIKAEGKAGRMGARLMAIVAEGERGRVYLSPIPDHEAVASKVVVDWKPEVVISGSTQYLGVKPYGMERFDQLFTNRQLVALSMFSDILAEVRGTVLQHGSIKAGYNEISNHFDRNDLLAAYADAVVVYLAFALSGLTDRMSSLCIWDPGGATWGTKLNHVFGRQALPMSWDFAEANPISTQSGSFSNSLDYTSKGIQVCGDHPGVAQQSDATHQEITQDKIVSTDPPYYDNIPYADLSDYFYVWLRRSLREIYADLFTTVAVPKSTELVAFSYRHATGKSGAESFFLNGMTEAMRRLAEQAHPNFPVSIYYAFKQAETASDAGTASTGWETFLDAVIRAGFALSGTWPVRTELRNRMRGAASDALASSIVLVCRRRSGDALTATRREFISALQMELPEALRHLQAGNIAPVDLAQAAIGPGMAVYTRYAKVLDAEGKPVSVRDALALINETLDEALAEQEGDFDGDSRWALAWFEQNGFAEDDYGVAEVLSKAKVTSVAGLAEAGIVESKRGKVRLLKPEELPADWDPTTDPRLTAWEVVHHLIRALASAGEGAAADLVAKLGSRAETGRELAYRLYTLCERKKRATEALAYNGLVQSWPEIARLAQEGGRQPTQAGLFEATET
jgi:putative DNA methylase